MSRPNTGHPLLMRAGRSAPGGTNTEPACLHDLCLDQVVETICTDHPRSDLYGVWWEPLRDVADIRFRQQVFEDLQEGGVLAAATRFAHEDLGHEFDVRTDDMAQDDGGHQHFHRARRFVQAAQGYCHTVVRLRNELACQHLRSAGLRALGEYLATYTSAAAFTTLHSEAQNVIDALDEIRYCVCIRGNRITVGRYDGEPDFQHDLSGTLARFRTGEVKSRAPEHEWDTFAGTGLLDLVAQVYPTVFARLDTFCATHADYLDEIVRNADRDLQFYLAYLDFIAPLRAAGLPFELPHLTTGPGSIQAHASFDLALAHHLHTHGGRAEQVVANDVALADDERLLVITGPNNGGKTTLARTVGQLHYLARLGCPVPGRDVHLPVCDHIYTHFERREDTSLEVGHLEHEMVSLRDDLAAATPAGLFILNEPFSSTTSMDAVRLTGEALRSISERGARAVCVTFLDELSTLDQNTVSMVAQVDPLDPTQRTFRIRRKPADGHAYAHALADKYGLTFDRLVQEIAR